MSIPEVIAAIEGALSLWERITVWRAKRREVARQAKLAKLELARLADLQKLKRILTETMKRNAKRPPPLPPAPGRP